MSAKWFQEQPGNRNFLAPSGFKMNLELFPGVDFFCQRANVPDVNAPFVDVSSKFRNVPLISSGGITYGDFTIKFIVDEDMKNYLTIYNWLQKNNLAEDFATSDIEYSEGQLYILNSNYQPNVIVNFEDLFPINLTGLDFDVADQDVEYLTAEVTFKFTRYIFRNKLNKEL
jgi:hypothetical protein